MTRPLQEAFIRADALRLFQTYSARDLANDAHGIWELAGDTTRCLTGKYDSHPLALKYAINLIDYFSGLWFSAHPAA